MCLKIVVGKSQFVDGILIEKATRYLSLNRY